MNFKFFTHPECPFYPCHDLKEWRSCLFCWCPLYLLDCGGTYTDTNGRKDCSGCVLPHTEEGYDHIVSKVSRLIYGR